MWYKEKHGDVLVFATYVPVMIDWLTQSLVSIIRLLCIHMYLYVDFCDYDGFFSSTCKDGIVLFLSLRCVTQICLSLINDKNDYFYFCTLLYLLYCGIVILNRKSFIVICLFLLQNIKYKPLNSLIALSS